MGGNERVGDNDKIKRGAGQRKNGGCHIATTLLQYSQFTQLRYLGEGEFATVHAEVLDGNPVALKILKQSKRNDPRAVKGLKREIMLMSGLKMETYFVVTYIFYLMQYAALIFVLWVVAVVLGDLQTFQIHDQGLLFVFFFLWGNVMVSFSFMLSSLFSDAKSAVTCTFMLIDRKSVV